MANLKGFLKIIGKTLLLVIIVVMVFGLIFTVGPPPLWSYEVDMLVASQIELGLFAACAITAVAGVVLFVRGKKRTGKVLLLLAMILFVLAMVVLPRIFIPPSPTPQTATLSVLQDVVNSPGTLQETSPVVFSKNTTLASGILASEIGLDPSQVCLDLGEYSGIEPNFKLLGTSEEGTQAIMWVGTTDEKANIAAVCATSGAYLNKYITDPYSEILTVPENCACLEKESRCCLVQLKRA